MATPANGDVTESFFHLSLDQSDHLSSGDDVSVHTMDDMLTFLRLAKAHDMNTRQFGARRDFSGDERSTTSENGYKSFKNDEVLTQTPRKLYKRFSSDPVLPSNATPFLHGRSFPRENGPRIRAQHDFDNNPDPNSTLNGTPAFPKPVRLAGMKGVDVELLFKAFQPLLDQYIQGKSMPVDEKTKKKTLSNVLPDSDPDSAADDTFDRPKRAGTSLGKHELSSPVTSPPQSSGDSRFVFDKTCAVNESDVCQQIPVQARDVSGERELKHGYSRGPQVELGDLTADEIVLDLTPVTNDTDPKPELETLELLRIKLEQYKKDNDGMLHEIEYLRCKLDAISAATATTNNNDNRNNSKRDQNTQNDTLAFTSGQNLTMNGGRDPDTAATNDAFEKNLPQQFRPYYQRLQLHKVDALSESEKSNLIKNLMLLLLVSDFDHLSVMTPKVGAYLRMTTLFLDALHESFYPDQEMKPSHYLRSYNIDINSELQKCLDGMMKLVLEPQ